MIVNIPFRDLFLVKTCFHYMPTHASFKKAFMAPVAPIQNTIDFNERHSHFITKESPVR